MPDQVEWGSCPILSCTYSWYKHIRGRVDNRNYQQVTIGNQSWSERIIFFLYEDSSVIHFSQTDASPRLISVEDAAILFEALMGFSWSFYV
jgi:hypothetical protein